MRGGDQPERAASMCRPPVPSCRRAAWTAVCLRAGNGPSKLCTLLPGQPPAAASATLMADDARGVLRRYIRPPARARRCCRCANMALAKPSNGKGILVSSYAAQSCADSAVDIYMERERLFASTALLPPPRTPTPPRTPDTMFPRQTRCSRPRHSAPDDGIRSCSTTCWC